MLLTQRDIKILNFINEFGFCVMPQIEKLCQLKKPRSYQIMKRLVMNDCVTHQRIYHGMHGVFYLTKNGARLTDLPPIQLIPRDNYAHQLYVVDTYLKIQKQFPDAVWLGERRLRKEQCAISLRRKKHFSDGRLLMVDGGEIAIEVELTLKSKRRLREIMEGYDGCESTKEVWYFCPPDLIQKLRKITDDYPKVEMHQITAS